MSWQLMARDRHGRHGPITTAWRISSLLSRCCYHASKHDWTKHRGRTGGSNGLSDFAQQVRKYRMTLCFARNPGPSFIMLGRRTSTKWPAQARSCESRIELPWPMSHVHLHISTTSPYEENNVCRSTFPCRANVSFEVHQPVGPGFLGDLNSSPRFSALAHGFRPVLERWGFSCRPCLVGMHKWIVAQTALMRLRLHFAALSVSCNCHFMHLEHVNLSSVGSVHLYSVGCSQPVPKVHGPRVRGKKTCYAASLSPGNLVHEQMAT